MTWFKVDDGFPEHRKLEELETNSDLWAACLAVWLAAGCDCSRRLTEGKISVERLSRITPFGRKAVAIAGRMVALGLWEKSGSSYLFHDWHDYQPEAEVVEERRENAKERKKKWDMKQRERRRRNGVTERVTERVTTPSVESNFNPDLERVTNAPPDPVPVPVPDPSPSRSRSRSRSLSSRERDVRTFVRSNRADRFCAIRCPGRITRRRHSATTADYA